MISVLVVDDSVVVRKLIVDALSNAPNIKVVGTASNGLLAQTRIDQLRPDVVTMDIEMPQMNGIEAVRELRKRHPRLPVIMFSTLSAAGASGTLEALAAGATDYVTKPANVGSIAESIAAVRQQLVPKIHVLAGGGAAPRPSQAPQHVPTAPGSARPTAPPLKPAAVRPPAKRGPQGRVDVIAIGSSTGGPDALAKVLTGLPSDLPVPIVVTQHMPPVFTRMFADRLCRSTPLTVVEAAEGMELAAGTVYVAPGDRHMMLRRRNAATVIQLSGAPPENSCRPAVDVMFRSVAQLYGPSAYAAVLTGMGQDGREGARVLRNAGAEVLAQDERSSVVWGMPGAVVGAGLADHVLPLDRMAAALVNRLKIGRSAAVVQ
ncbi:MAG TPA: chemotaxis response regulator protein-glutamate methylesterase [Actinoplanes sp.]|nr:chemotaxis response regulator protein-glutamate methylesterase [Actinoplanes sp.]